MTEGSRWHPSDIELSAHLDGEAAEAAAAQDLGRPTQDLVGHLAGCERCSARLGQLTAVRGVLSRAVVLPDPDVKQRALDRALEIAASAPGARLLDDPVAPRRHRTRFVLIGGVAAAAAALALALPLTLSSSRASVTSSAAGSISGHRASAPYSGRAPGGTLLDKQSLGAIADVADLQRAVRQLDPGLTFGSVAPAPSSALAQAANGALAQAAATTTTAAPSKVDPRCVSAAAEAGGGKPIDAGSGVYRGTPVYVIVVQPAHGAVVGLALSRTGCHLLATTQT